MYLFKFRYGALSLGSWMRFVIQYINRLNDISDYLSESWRYRSLMSSYNYLDTHNRGLHHPRCVVKNVSIAYDFQNQNPQPTYSVLFEGNSRYSSSITEEAKLKHNRLLVYGSWFNGVKSSHLICLFLLFFVSLMRWWGVMYRKSDIQSFTMVHFWHNFWRWGWWFLRIYKWGKFLAIGRYFGI